MKDLRAIRIIPDLKISHDYNGNTVNTFSYRDLCEKNIESIGIACKPSGIVVIDIDVAGESHQKDGREFWSRLVKELDIPTTYTVRTPSGGFHFYYKLPEHINPESFHPPGQLADGVDIKWKGFVGAPPTLGYVIVNGTIQNIVDLPANLITYMAELKQGANVKTFDYEAPVNGTNVLELHQPFTPWQLEDLTKKIEWMQSNATLSRSEWRDGLFSLKAGIRDINLLHELATKWTMNGAYVQGDEDEAIRIVDRADSQGGVGPGTILAIIESVRRREGMAISHSPFSVQEILDKSKVVYTYNTEGKVKLESSESNAAALIGAVFEESRLYYDARSDLYMLDGEGTSDVDIVNKIIPMIQSSTVGLGLEKFKKSSISGGLDVLMMARKKDPHQTYLKSLTWDGVPRIEKFFSEYVGAEDSEYIRRVGKNFWTALAARGLNPGCKFDSMVIIEGSEGIAKSTLVKAIGGEYTFVPDGKDSFSDTDELRKMHQSIIVELPELMGLIGQSSEKIKAFLAKSSDSIRALFARKAIVRERGFVLIGTTNSDRYLPPSAGARRFWPVKIPKGSRVNIGAIQTDRDQLFAEGIALYKDRYPFWDIPDHILHPVVEERVIEDPIASPIKQVLADLGSDITTSRVYSRLENMGFLSKGLTTPTVARIESCLSRAGLKLKEGMWSNAVQPTISLDDLI